MKGAFRFGRVAGVDLEVHWTFSLIFVLVIGQGLSSGREMAGILYIVLATTLLFACVMLHELGHVWMARRLNVLMTSITLLPFGGFARRQSLPQNPVHELLIAVAGPLVNLGLALSLAGLLLLVDSRLLTGFLGSPRSMVDAIFLQAPFWQSPVLGLVIFLIFANAVLFAFNLIPTLPLDGGRVLWAILALFFPLVRATQLAIGLGQLVAIGLVITALRVRSLGLLVIAILVLVAGLPLLAGPRR